MHIVHIVMPLVDHNDTLSSLYTLGEYSRCGCNMAVTTTLDRCVAIMDRIEASLRANQWLGTAASFKATRRRGAGCGYGLNALLCTQVPVREFETAPRGARPLQDDAWPAWPLPLPHVELVLALNAPCSCLQRRTETECPRSPPWPQASHGTGAPCLPSRAPSSRPSRPGTFPCPKTGDVRNPRRLPSRMSSLGHRVVCFV